jgi:hypothetical protein
VVTYRRKSKSRSRRKSRTRSKARRNPSRRRRSVRRTRSFRRVRSNPGRRRTKSRVRRTRSRSRVRRNPSRRISRRTRRNPSMRGIVPNKAFVIQALGIIGGFVAGKMITPYYAQIPGINGGGIVSKVAPGALNLLLGAFVAKQKNAMLKPVGIGLAASGLASILGNFFPSLSLGMDLSADVPNMMGAGEVVRIGDEMVRISGDDEGGYDGESVYERI